MNIDFKNIKTVNIAENNINKIYKGNNLIWKLSESLKYPINLLNMNINDLSFLDVDNPKVDYNALISVFIEYTEFMRSPLRFATNQPHKEYIKYFMKGKNELIDSKTMKNKNWVYNSDWKIDNDKFMQNDVYKYTGSWNYITYNFEIKPKTNQNFIFSFYAKTDKNNIDGSIFINDELGNNSDISSETFKSIKLSNNWERYFIEFNINNESEQTKYIQPNIQLPINATLYLSSYMLSKGNILYDWDNGELNVSEDFKDLIDIFSNSDYTDYKDGMNEKFIIYDKYYNQTLNEKLKPYMDKLIFIPLNNKEEVINKFKLFPDEIKKQKNINTVISKRLKDDFYFKQEFKSFEDSFIKNINMGYAPYSRWGDYDKDISTVYMDMRWNEVETEKEKYNWENWEKLTRWQFIKSKGYSVIFRLILDEPTDKKHSDIPNDLTISKYGRYYTTDYGKGFAPDYSNREFIERYIKFVNTFINRYINQNDNIISIIQFGIIGHWGEFHIHPNLPKLPSSSILKEYLLPFVSNTRNIEYMFRRPFKFIEDFQINYPDNTYGVYNDMIGDKEETEIWLNWLDKGGEYESLNIQENDMVKPYIDYYHKGLVGGEFTSSTPMKTMLVDNLQQTIDLIKNSHTSIIGQKTPLKENISDEEFENAYNKIQNELGYKLAIRNIKLSFPKNNINNTISLTLENKGNVDMIGNFKIYLYVYNNKLKSDYSSRNKILIDTIEFSNLKAGEVREINKISTFKNEQVTEYSNKLFDVNFFFISLYEINVKVITGNNDNFDVNLCNKTSNDKNRLLFYVD